MSLDQVGLPGSAAEAFDGKDMVLVKVAVRVRDATTTLVSPRRSAERLKQFKNEFGIR